MDPNFFKVYKGLSEELMSGPEQGVSESDDKNSRNDSQKMWLPRSLPWATRVTLASAINKRLSRITEDLIRWR